MEKMEYILEEWESVGEVSKTKTHTFIGTPEQIVKILNAMPQELNFEDCEGLDEKAINKLVEEGIIR